MEDQSSNFSYTNPTQNHKNKPISPSLGSPRFFNGLLTRSLSDTGINKTTKNTSQFQTSWGRLYDAEYVTSPNSTHDGMQNVNLRNPFGHDSKSSSLVTKSPRNDKSFTITSQFQTSRDVPSPNSNLDGMKNCNLRNPFGYDGKSSSPITKKPPNDESFETTSQYDVDSIMTSPNPILDGVQNLNIRNPFGYDRKPPNPVTKKPPNNKLEPESIGLALIDPNGSSEKSPFLFRAKLRVEIPCPIEVKNTCGDLGEMESSEDYTCVITHGPNPRTTHIFDNCIVESCCGERKLSQLTRENSCKVDHTKAKTSIMDEREPFCHHQCDDESRNGMIN